MSDFIRELYRSKKSIDKKPLQVMIIYFLMEYVTFSYDFNYTSTTIPQKSFSYINLLMLGGNKKVTRT